jgi:RNA polymerase sigma factor (sigma-70 family)
MHEYSPQVARFGTVQQGDDDGCADSCEMSSQVENDSSLMQRIAGGEEAALEELVALHGQMLVRLIGRLTSWHGDCDDIFQEVLLAAWRRSHRYREAGSCEAWLKRIAVNRVKNHFRTLSRLQRKLEHFADRLASIETPEAVILPQEATEPMHLAMRKLSAADRTIVVLVYLEDMPMVEVAEIVGVTPATLHVRLHRARERLKESILEQESEGKHE